MNIAVVGLGAAGLSTCWHLARMGHQATGYEQFSLFHSQGSSHGTSRIIRYTYPDPFYTRLMSSAYMLWAELEAETNSALLQTTGILFLAPSSHPALHAAKNALLAAGKEHALLSPSACSKLAPAIQLASHEMALYQPEGGFLRANSCLQALAQAARKQGAVLYDNCPVQSIQPCSNGTVQLQVNGRTLIYDKLVTAAGPWMHALFPTLKLPLTVTRQQVTYLAVKSHAEWFEPHSLPVWIDADTLEYGFPKEGSNNEVKIASHTAGMHVHPDQVQREVDAEYIEHIVRYASRRFPDLASTVTQSQVCLYTSTTNEDFILDCLPGSPQIWLLSGCSGHGFKFSVLQGQLAACHITGAPVPADTSRFRLAAHIH